MSEQVPQPIPPEHGAGDGSVAPAGSVPRVSLDKGSGREPAGTALPAQDGSTSTPAAGVEADPWAPQVSAQGVGATVVSDVSDAPPFSGPSAAAPASAPQPPVHDQQTVVSLSAPEAPGDLVPPAWARPADPFAPPAPAPSAPGQANPFAPSAGTPSAPGRPAPFAPSAGAPSATGAPAHPFAPPSGGPANPFAPPGPGSQAGAPAHPYAPPAPVGLGNPYAPPPAAAAQPLESVPVPPPPISPDGPGQVPYGYPGAPAAYGYPAPQPHPGYGGPGIPAYPAAAGYGWPGMRPQPNNGMGTASLVLGILSVVGFCAWPMAIVMAVLAVVLGSLGRAKARRGEADNPGVALAGIICGAAGIVLLLGLFAFAIAFYK
ncbi:DUF4190 domain-containing protein [Streptomyces collinus]|uniref:DUF4190 domain-containing protein n=1 Tax=Streptomyces collinus TaxID=42684 RepID=UPI002943E1A0|nr:DUF4190 domain-containing protein [Streptomyces collinus]